jgi:hypothetical protein
VNRGSHDNPDVTTVYLGQFTREHANAIAGELEEQRITWWYKEPGLFSQIWEYGVRLFVDREYLQVAKDIAARITGQSAPPEDAPGAP